MILYRDHSEHGKRANGMPPSKILDESIRFARDLLFVKVVLSTMDQSGVVSEDRSPV